VIRLRAVVATLTCGAAMMMVVGAGVGDASAPPAQTGVATYVKSTLAQLNGTIHPDGLDAFWAFQYGTSATAYGHTTPTIGPVTGTAPVAVATLAGNLQPGTTYHFRLVDVRGQAGVSGDAQGYVGSDEKFTTPSSAAKATRGGAHARASLRSHTLAVRHGAAVMAWGCAGTSGAECKGRVSLTARAKIADKVETVSCGSGRFSAATGKRGTVRATLGTRCLALVESASHHRLGASLKSAFSAGTGPARTGVTLVLG
jgi:hypothetical protein